MAKRRIEFKLDPSRDVETNYKQLHGGTEANWNWLQRKLEKSDPAVLKDRIKKFGRVGAYLPLPPCYLYGRFDVPDENAWWEGVVKAKFMIEDVCSEEYREAVYKRRLAEIPSDEQEV